MAYPPIFRKTRSEPPIEGKGEPLTDDDYDLTIYGIVRRLSALEAVAIAVGDEPPANPVEGQLWVDTSQ